MQMCMHVLLLLLLVLIVLLVLVLVFVVVHLLRGCEQKTPETNAQSEKLMKGVLGAGV